MGYDHAYRRHLSSAWEQREAPASAEFIRWRRSNGLIVELFPIGPGHASCWTVAGGPTQGTICGCVSGYGAENLIELLRRLDQR